jgi:hypothetical protein
MCISCGALEQAAATASNMTDSNDTSTAVSQTATDTKNDPVVQRIYEESYQKSDSFTSSKVRLPRSIITPPVNNGHRSNNNDLSSLSPVNNQQAPSAVNQSAAVTQVGPPVNQSPAAVNQSSSKLGTILSKARINGSTDETVKSNPNGRINGSTDQTVKSSVLATTTTAMTSVNHQNESNSTGEVASNTTAAELTGNDQDDQQKKCQ